MQYAINSVRNFSSQKNEEANRMPPTSCTTQTMNACPNDGRHTRYVLSKSKQNPQLIDSNWRQNK